MVDPHQLGGALVVDADELPHTPVTAPNRIARVGVQVPVAAEIPAHSHKMLG